MTQTPDHPPSTQEPDIWQLASGYLPPALAEKVGTVQQWAEVRTDVEILRALQPGAEDARLAKLEGLTLSQRISAIKLSTPVDKQLKELTTAIVHDYGRGEAGRDALIIIARVLETENTFRLVPLPIPEVPRKQPRQTNPFEHTNAVDAIRTMRWLQAAVHTWIDAVKTPESNAIDSESYENDLAFCVNDSEFDENSSESRVPAGLIALSAIVEGDLLHHSSVHALRLRLLDPKCPIEWWGEVPSEGRVRRPFRVSRPFIDLSLGWGSTDDAELRRWFPDPQTACLIARAYRKQTLDIDENATRLSQLWFEIREGLQAHGGEIDDPPRSLAALLSVVRLCRFIDNYPALLVNYCGRRIVSHSVRRLILPRFAGEGLSLALNETPGPTSLPAFPLSQSLDTVSTTHISSSRWYRDLLDAFKEEDKNQAQKNLELLAASLANYPGSARCIMGFAAFAIANGSAAGNRLALSTVRSYTSVVARYLGGYLRGEHPTSFSSSELISIYGEVLDLADQARNARAARRRLGRALWEFHYYLVTKYRIPGVNQGDVFGIGRDLVPVDANLLTPDEYFKVRDKVLELAPKSELGDLGDLARILLSLGFWLGLRRTEAHGLRTIDVCELGVPMLVVRPWDGRRLKSKASTRILPLALLPEDELSDLLRWTYKRRRAELDGSGKEQFLFGLPKQAQDQVTVEVFALVQRAMREVTGDHTLRYHHLRHSAASLAFLRLCVSDFREVIDLFPEPKTNDLLRDSERFRAIIYSAFPIDNGEARYELLEEDRYTTDGPIRQHSFAVALLLGHADPSTTLEHYIHFLDIVLPIYRRNREFFPISRLGVIRASGFSDATGYRYDVEDLPAEVWRHLDSGKQIAPDLPNKGSIYSPHGGDLLWIDRLRHILYSADKEHLPNDELAARHEIEPSTIAVLIRRARELRATDLHTMESWVPDLRYAQDKRELCCPYRSPKAADRSIIQRLEYAHIQALADSGFRNYTERVLNYYVANQKDNGPLLFEDPARPEDAQAYLSFLEGLGIQRLNVENKLAPEGISRPSEIRLVCHDPQARLRWREALPFKSRDVLWPKRARQAESDSTQRLGILAHLNTAPEKPLVGNLGFRFFMLMAWIAWPWLVNETGANIFHLP